MRRQSEEKHIMERKAKRRLESITRGMNRNLDQDPLFGKEYQVGRYRKNNRLGCPTSNCRCKLDKNYHKDIPEKQSDVDFRDQLGEL